MTIYLKHRKNLIPVTFALLLLLTANPVCASDVIDVLPLTRDIIMVHFYDGYVIYHKNGQPRSNEKAVVFPLQTWAKNYVSCERAIKMPVFTRSFVMEPIQTTFLFLRGYIFVSMKPGNYPSNRTIVKEFF